MNKKQLAITLAQIGLSLVPGSKPAVDAIIDLVHKDDDPTNDLDEIADKLADAIIKTAAAAENMEGRDILNEPAVLAIKAQIVATIKLVPHVLVRRAA